MTTVVAEKTSKGVLVVAFLVLVEVAGLVFSHFQKIPAFETILFEFEHNGHTSRLEMPRKP